MKRTRTRKKNKYNILAIDPATNCGWAINTKIYGTWNLSVRKDESDGMRIIRFRSKFLEILEKENINLVVFERPAGRNARGLITQSEIQSQMKSICIDKNIAYRAYSAGEIKKFATGKGNSGKPAMIQAAKDKLDYPGENDNEADALWMYMLAKNEYEI